MKRRIVIMFFLLVGLIAPGIINGAAAAEINPVDVQAIREVVQSQLDAFAEDDAAKAFDLSTTGTRELLGTPQNFLQLVKDRYPAVYRHRLVLFSAAEVVDGKTLQIVRITDRDNSVWLAIYEMQQEPDGSWKIDGCNLLETRSVSI